MSVMGDYQGAGLHRQIDGGRDGLRHCSVGKGGQHEGHRPKHRFHAQELKGCGKKRDGVDRRPDMLLQRVVTVSYPAGPRPVRSLRLSWRSRSEEHTSELQSLMRISYAVFCLKKKKHTIHTIPQ